MKREIQTLELLVLKKDSKTSLKRQITKGNYKGQDKKSDFQGKQSTNSNSNHFDCEKSIESLKTQIEKLNLSVQAIITENNLEKPEDYVVSSGINQISRLVTKANENSLHNRR